MDGYKTWLFALFLLTNVTNVIKKRHKWWYMFYHCLNIYRRVQTYACTSRIFLTCYPFKLNYTSHSRTSTSCALRPFIPIWAHLMPMPILRLCECGRAESERDLNCTKSVASKHSYILSVWYARHAFCVRLMWVLRRQESQNLLKFCAFSTVFQ